MTAGTRLSERRRGGPPSCHRRGLEVPARAAVLGLLGLATGACGARVPPGAPEPGTIGPDWVRRVAPFPVADEDGHPYPEPFLGGWDQPRPQLVDIDGDGDLDLFLQERSGAVMLFERRPPGAEPRFAWRTDRWGDLDVGEWFRFVDLDGDGDLDLLGERRYSLIRAWKNEGSARRPRFRPVVDTLRDAAGEPIFSDRQNIPNAADVDCDGRLDLLLGRLVGTITRYEEVPGTGVAPRFRHVEDRFQGIEIVARVGSLHGANTLVLEDVDDDGDPDLFWGDFFEPGLLWIENAGSCARPLLSDPPVPFPPGDPIRTSGYNAATFGDLDGDGDRDLLIGVLGGAYGPSSTTRDNLLHLERTPAGFELRTRRFLRTLDVGSESVPRLVDVDADGDLDLLVANKRETDPAAGTARVRLWRNVGSAAAPDFVYAGTLGLAPAFHPAPEAGDLDGDGIPELVVGTWGDAVALYRRSADGAGWTVADSVLVRLGRGRHAAPALGDLDGDGDLDLVVGESSGTLNLWRNDGTPGGARFVPVSEEWLGIDVGRRSVPALVDLDHDGDPDLVVGSDGQGLRWFRNDGPGADAGGDATLTRMRELEGPPLPVHGFAAPAFGDVDGDGDPDLLVGGAGGGLLFFENRTPGDRQALPVRSAPAAGPSSVRSSTRSSRRSR